MCRWRECLETSVSSYHRPCYCCTCRGCPDGIVDIRATVGGVGLHVGLSMPNAEEFVEKLQPYVWNARAL